MRRPLGSSHSAASALLLACLGVPLSDGFAPATTSSSGTHQHEQQYSRSSSQLNAFLGRYMIDVGPSSETGGRSVESPPPATGSGNDVSTFPSSSLSRRDALGQAATAAMVTAATVSSTGVSPAFAEGYTTEPTKIELNVETEYLIRALETFNGDMRQVLPAIVRSPFTNVVIDPPNKDKDTARDAILRALYSYEAPEDYLEQASWLDVGETDNSFVGWLTQKRYRISVPNFPPGEELPLKTTVTLSNLEAAVAAGVLSYPLTYGYYKYEGYWEEQEAKARKEAAAAKRAAAAKAKKGKAKPGKEGSTKASSTNTPKKAKAPMTKNKSGEAAKAKPAAIEGATTVAAAASVASTEEKSKPQGPPPNADAVWQKLQSEMAKNTPQEPILPPVIAAEDIAPLAEVPVAAAPAPAPAPVASTPSNVAGGMSAYESYLEQAYARAPAPVPVTPADATSSAAAYAPLEPAVATLVEEKAEPVVARSSAQPLPKTTKSPFGGGYLDSLSP